MRIRMALMRSSYPCAGSDESPKRARRKFPFFGYCRAAVRHSLATMQWLFSTFPKGMPGFGLILLRVVTALSLQTNAAGHLALSAHLSLPGVVSIVISLALLVGIVTPIAAVLGALIASATLVTSPEMASAFMLQNPLICIA